MPSRPKSLKHCADEGFGIRRAHAEQTHWGIGGPNPRFWKTAVFLLASRWYSVRGLFDRVRCRSSTAATDAAKHHASTAALIAPKRLLPR
eukprot:gene15245-biopygen11785